MSSTRGFDQPRDGGADPRHVDDAAQLGALGHPIRRARPQGDRPRLARARRRHRRAAPRPVRRSEDFDRRHRRPLRQAGPRPRSAAHHHRPLVRRSLHAAPGEPRPWHRHGRARHGRAERRPASAAFDGSVPPGRRSAIPQTEEGDTADVRPVQLVLHQCTQQRGLAGRLRPLLHPGFRVAPSSRPGSPTSTRTRRPRSTTATRSGRHCCLLTGDEDRICPPAINKATFTKQRQAPSATEHKEYPGRCHLPGQAGWEDVADYALSWAIQHKK